MNIEFNNLTPAREYRRERRRRAAYNKWLEASKIYSTISIDEQQTFDPIQATCTEASRFEFIMHLPEDLELVYKQYPYLNSLWQAVQYTSVYTTEVWGDHSTIVSHYEYFVSSERALKTPNIAPHISDPLIKSNLQRLDTWMSIEISGAELAALGNKSPT